MQKVKNSGYAAKDNTRITCANNNRWYAEKDFKQLDELDNAKVSKLLECITCQDSWEDIANWYRVSGPFENEVIVEGMDSRVTVEKELWFF